MVASIIYKGTIGFAATYACGDLYNGMPLARDARVFGVWDGQFWARERARSLRGSSQEVLVSIDTYGLLDQHSFQAHQGASSKGP